MIEGAADRAAVERAGRAAFPGFRLQALAITPSTQDVVRTAARAGASAGFCCVADEQSSGRGRQQRSWDAPAATSLLTSVLVRVMHPRLGGVSIAAGLAVRAAVESTSGCVARLKWPNDVVVGGRKLAGILCEVEPAAPGGGTAVVVGAGVNLHLPSFPPEVPGISLHELVPDPPSRWRVLAALLTELAARLTLLADSGLDPVRAEWMLHATGIGEVLTASSAAGQLTGVAVGLDDDGALLLRGPSGLVRVLAGDVHVGRYDGSAPPP